MANVIDGAVTINGTLTVTGGVTLQVGLNRTNNVLETDMDFAIPLTQWRVWDALGVNLATAGTDDLGLTSNTFGTSTPYLTSGDLNAAGSITRYARALYQMPHNYQGGQNFTFQISAGMLTAVASVAATVDAEIYVTNGTTGITAAGDVCATSATSINSTTFAVVSFTVTGATIERGDILDIRITIAANSATASTHFAAITDTNFRLPIKG